MKLDQRAIFLIGCLWMAGKEATTDLLWRYAMNLAVQSRLWALLVGMALLAGARPAHSQMVPLHDHREIHATATYEGLAGGGTLTPSAPFAAFEDYLDPMSETENGEADGQSYVQRFVRIQ